MEFLSDSILSLETVHNIIFSYMPSLQSRPEAMCGQSLPSVLIERNFPQGKLDSEINVPFLLNEHGDIFFYHIITVHIIILFDFKNFYRTEKKI